MIQNYNWQAWVKIQIPIKKQPKFKVPQSQIQWVRPNLDLGSP